MSLDSGPARSAERAGDRGQIVNIGGTVGSMRQTASMRRLHIDAKDDLVLRVTTSATAISAARTCAGMPTCAYRGGPK
jgi:hypothetical protein